MIYWTHIYDLFAKLVALVASVALTLWAITPLHLSSHVDGLMVAGSLVFLGIPLYFFLMRTVGSLMYCRIALGAKFSFGQARQLDGVLAPILPLLWCPMKEVRDVADSGKFDAAVRLAEAWKRERRQFVQDRDQRLKEQPSWFRLVRGILTALAIIAFAMGFMVIPPFDKLAAFQAAFDSTHSYSAILNGVLGALPPLILLKFLDVRVGIHRHYVE